MMAIDRGKCREISQNCTFFNLRRATRAVGEIYDRILAPSGLRGTQLSLLVGIASLHEASVTGLAKALELDRTTLSRNLAPLERQGWIESVCGVDSRERLIRLTDRGSRKLTQAMKLWDRAQKIVVRELGEARWQALLSSLKRSTGSLSRLTRR